MEPFELNVATPRPRRQVGALAPPQRVMRWGRGAWVEDVLGQRFFDGTGSGGTVLFGHGDPEIVAALKEQLTHTTFPARSGHTHAGAEQLTELLTTISPPGLSRVYYSENARGALERAMSLSHHHWRLTGKDKWRFVVFNGSWHESLATESHLAGALGRSVATNPVLLSPPPPRYETIERDELAEDTMLAALDKLLTIRGPEIAAVVIEPRFLPEAGACLYSDDLFDRVLSLCRQYNVHSIVDETLVGLGRTGSLFACEHAQNAPDFLCLGESLASGFAAIGTTLVAASIQSEPRPESSPRLADNTVPSSFATTAALSVLKRFEQHDVLSDIATRAGTFRAAADALLEDEQVVGVAHRGLVFVIDVEEPSPSSDADHHLLASLFASELERDGVLSNLCGSSIYLTPPYVVSNAEIEQVVSRMRTALARAAKL